MGDMCRIRRNGMVGFASDLEDYTKNADAPKKLLTTGNRNARIHSKLNRLIEARYPSVPPAKPVQLRNGKGATAEVLGRCLLSGCWVGREHLPDCHKFFVKRYHWLFGETRFSGPVFRIFHEPLGKAVHFFHHSQPAGKTIRRTRRRQS